MKLLRRRFLHLSAGAAALSVLPRTAAALDYPTRPVRLIVGFSAGSSADINARLIGQWMSQRLGQPFIIENRPGASGSIATEEVVRAIPDGYTLLTCVPPNVTNGTLYNNLKFNFIRDIAPIATILRAGGVMEVNPSVPAKTVPEFIAYAKASPGKINVAATGRGSLPHLYAELFEMMAGVDLVTVQYPGAGPALSDLIGGRVEVMFDVVISSIEHIRAGKVRPLGVTSATRLIVLPDVPPIGDFVSGYEGIGWMGVGAPKNTPTEIIDKLNNEINTALADPTFTARLANLGAMPFASTPVGFGKFIANETEKWAKVIKFANIKPE